MTPDELKRFRDFLTIIDSSETSAEFTINCTLWAMGHYATKKFFDELFDFVYGSSSARGEELKLRIKLRSNMPKLQRFYAELLDEF